VADAQVAITDPTGQIVVTTEAGVTVSGNGTIDLFPGAGFSADNDPAWTVTPAPVPRQPELPAHLHSSLAGCFDRPPV
jgi:hypothetical protein